MPPPDSSRLTRRIERLTGQVAALSSREAKAQVELDKAEARLQVERRNLRVLRDRLARSIDLLEWLLVAIGRPDDPNALSVTLEAGQAGPQAGCRKVTIPNRPPP